MEKIDYKFLINQFLDGELEKKKERELFEVLAYDEECRNYFKQVNMIKSVAHEDQAEFPGDLEERIMYSVGTLSEKSTKLGFFNNKIFAIAAYAVAVVLIALSVHLITITNVYKKDLEITRTQLIKKENTLDKMLYNILPEVKVTNYKLDRFNYPNGSKL